MEFPCAPDRSWGKRTSTEPRSVQPFAVFPEQEGRSARDADGAHEIREREDERRVGAVGLAEVPEHEVHDDVAGVEEAELEGERALAPDADGVGGKQRGEG